MTLMPKHERDWTLKDVLQWLAILAVICFLLQLYTLVLSRLRKSTLGHPANAKGARHERIRIRHACNKKTLVLMNLWLVLLQDTWCSGSHGPDIAGEIDNARRLVRAGKVRDAEHVFSTLYRTHPADLGFQISYARFLYSCGEYEHLVREFQSSSAEIIREIVRKAQGNIRREAGADAQVLEELVRESPHSKRLLTALVRRLVEGRMYTRARQRAEELLAYHGGDDDVKHLYAHTCVISGMYSRGIAMLQSIGRHGDARKLEELIAAYESTVYSKNRLDALRALLSEISIAELETSVYTPSLYTHLRYSHVLYDYVWLGVEQRVPGMSKYARELHQFMSTDNTAYLRVMSLVIDGDSSAEDVYRREGPQSKLLRQALERELEGARKRREQGSDAQTGLGEGDPRGYYKVLGVAPGATVAQIRSAFRKKSLENEYKHLKEADPQEYARREKQQTLLNNAYDCLKNTKSRQRYDAGLDSSPSPGTAGNYDTTGVEDFLRTFFGSGFGGFASDAFHSHGRSGSRTYFYRYV
ncbi:UNVERIFIED_CONTAM: hypothetical protein PYX00_011420 [Menopon gallinae]|uniref:J domain-containing protein n=1 Tax=Menopon gallinae TaxID=328185 RepID=A0AAW2H7N4_9NEOP